MIQQQFYAQVPMSQVKGHWISAEEHLTYGDSGSISLKLTRMTDGKVLMNYSKGGLKNFFVGDYMRPKWGFYRSLNNKQQLRDETVYFTDVKIQKE
jgi:hypothetical protein